MKARIVACAKEWTVRIPKRLLDKAGHSGDVEIVVDGQSLVIRKKAGRPRANWAQEFRRMAELGEDEIFDDFIGDWPDSQWESNH